MTNEELEAIRERAEKATPGPWAIGDADTELMNGKISHIGPVNGYDGDWLDMEPDDPNAEFIAHAREDIPALLAEVERLRAAVEIARDNHAITARQWEAAKAQNAAMREIVQAVADLEPDMPDGDSFSSDAGYHVDQIIRQARALLQEGI